MGALAGNDIAYGMLPGNIGYIRFATFDPEDLWTRVPEAMATVRGTAGLVLDVRNNNGGQRQNVSALVSSFLTDTLTWLQAIEADGVPFEPWEPIPPDPGRYTYGAPVVVLINGASISAAEILAETMRQLPGVTVVGDTTAGAVCNDRDETPGDRTLPSGIRIHIPTGCLLGYDGLPMEWRGVPPDIRVPQTQADIEAGRDLQLEYALSLLP
jgi:C-terminal processing protease CtpA/Prc